MKRNIGLLIILALTFPASSPSAQQGTVATPQAATITNVASVSDAILWRLTYNNGNQIIVRLWGVDSHPKLGSYEVENALSQLPTFEKVDTCDQQPKQPTEEEYRRWQCDDLAQILLEKGLVMVSEDLKLLDESRRERSLYIAAQSSAANQKLGGWLDTADSVRSIVERTSLLTQRVEDLNKLDLAATIPAVQGEIGRLSKEIESLKETSIFGISDLGFKEVKDMSDSERDIVRSVLAAVVVALVGAGGAGVWKFGADVKNNKSVKNKISELKTYIQNDLPGFKADSNKRFEAPNKIRDESVYFRLMNTLLNKKDLRARCGSLGEKLTELEGKLRSANTGDNPEKKWGDASTDWWTKNQDLFDTRAL